MLEGIYLTNQKAVPSPFPRHKPIHLVQDTLFRYPAHGIDLTATTPQTLFQHDSWEGP